MDQLPEIRTERLVLSAPTANDIPRILEYAQNPVISQNLLTFPFPYAESDAVFWINHSYQGCKSGDHYIFAIRSAEDQQLIGGIGITVTKQFNRAELGYWLGEPHWGKGYATEAARAIIHFAFNTVALNKITCSHLTNNPASGRIMIKNGMVKEGLLAEQVLKEGNYLDLVVYGITRKQFDSLLPEKP